MRILYLSFSYLPSRRANTVHVMKMCQALAALGHRVTLVGKRPPSTSDPGPEGTAPEDTRPDGFARYGIQPIFDLRRLWRPAIRGGEVVFALLVGLEVLRARDVDLVYSRYPLGAWLAARLGVPTVFEVHGLRGGRWWRGLIRGILGGAGFRRLVLISEALRRDMDTAGLLPADIDVRVAPDAADVAPRRPERRPAGGGALGYVGGFYRGRGLELMATVARRLPDCTLHLVGGTRDDLGALLDDRIPPNVVCHGHVAHADLAGLYERFDILLMPYQRRVAVASGGIDTGRWMSPLKLFEYMAQGLPIVSSDLPVLREVLRHEHNALLAPPDDAGAWVAAVRRLLTEDELRRGLGATARREQIDLYTWEGRARAVLAELPGESAP